MSANDSARLNSSAREDLAQPARRTLLTSALAGLAVSGTAYTAQAVTAAPDPIFALLEAERQAYAAMDASYDRLEATEIAFAATGLDRRARVQVGTFTSIVDREGSPLPPSEYKAEPIYVHDEDAIGQHYGSPDKPLTIISGRRRVQTTATRDGAYDEALAEFRADQAAIDAARLRCGVGAASQEHDATIEAHDAALNALFSAKPTTAAGLVAMLDAFELREMELVHDPLGAWLLSIFAAVRGFVGEA